MPEIKSKTNEDFFWSGTFRMFGRATGSPQDEAAQNFMTTARSYLSQPRAAFPILELADAVTPPSALAHVSDGFLREVISANPQGRGVPLALKIACRAMDASAFGSHDETRLISFVTAISPLVHTYITAPECDDACARDVALMIHRFAVRRNQSVRLVETKDKKKKTKAGSPPPPETKITTRNRLSLYGLWDKCMDAVFERAPFEATRVANATRLFAMEGSALRDRASAKNKAFIQHLSTATDMPSWSLPKLDDALITASFFLTSKGEKAEDRKEILNAWTVFYRERVARKKKGLGHNLLRQAYDEAIQMGASIPTIEEGTPGKSLPFSAKPSQTPPSPQRATTTETGQQAGRGQSYILGS